HAAVDHVEQVAYALAATVVGGDHPADRDAPAHVHARQGRVQVSAADVLEIDVDAVRRGRLQRLGERLGLVVDHRVQPDLVLQPADLVVGAGGADHVAALDLGDLGGDRANRAGGGGDEHLLAVLQGADVQQAAVGGEAGHPQGVHVHRQRQVRLRRQPGQALAVGA